MNFLKRIYIWCRRFRYRKGYGVHSPFAFGLITEVIYEKLPYYAYAPLKAMRKEASKSGMHCTERVDKLLFRLANRFQPEYLLEAGTGAGLSLCYLAAGRTGARCVSLCDGTPSLRVEALLAGCCKNGRLAGGEILETLQSELEQVPRIDLLHIAHTDKYRQVFEKSLPYLTADALVVVSGIHADAARLAWWNELVADGRTGITFDLYEVGLVFFNRVMNKQHYMVNF